jgi:hypothetical protein
MYSFASNKEGTMFAEYLQLLGLTREAALSPEFAKKVCVLALVGLVLLVTGYKIKGVWGAIVALSVGTVVFLFLENLLYLVI